MIAAGVKTDAQILEELIPTVAPGLTQLADATVSGNIQKALKAGTDAGFAYIMTKGEASYLAIVNATGACKLYNVEGAEVTADHADLVAEAKAHAAVNQKSYAEAFIAKIGEMMDGATDVTAIEVNSFDTIVAAVSFKVDESTYYGFYSRISGWDSRMMDNYFVIDENGAIAKMDAESFVFEETDFEHYGGFEGMPADYADKFAGITGETFTGDEIVISKATFSTNAIKQSTKDAFAAFNSIKGGEQ